MRIGEVGVKATAFRNADGSMVVELLNTSTTAVSTSFATDTPIHRRTVHLTDETHSLSEIATTRHRPGSRTVPADLPPRSLTTIVLR